jgi:hypothetical protein
MNQKILQNQERLSDVKSIISSNINQVLGRGANLIDLQRKAEELTSGADEFGDNAYQTKRNAWLRNLKWIISITVIVIILIIGLGLIIGLSVYFAAPK